MSRADNIVEARLDRFLRAEDAARIPKNAFLDRSIVAAKGSKGWTPAEGRT
jgi:hypothetical protein